MSVTNAAEMFSQLSQVRTSMVAKYTELEQSLLEASTEIESAVSEKFALKQAVSEESNELERLVEGAGAPVQQSLLARYHFPGRPWCWLSLPVAHPYANDRRHGLGCFLLRCTLSS